MRNDTDSAADINDVQSELEQVDRRMCLVEQHNCRNSRKEGDECNERVHLRVRIGTRTRSTSTRA
jgi:hypothetical protein